MKTKVEINGYEIEIEERDGLISVTATFEDEVVEEFQIETEEGQGDEEGQEDVQGFDEFGQDEEEDFGQDDEEGQEDEEEEEEGQEEDEDESQDEFEGKLESFQSFISKKR
jgi:hypothetical protein